MTVNAHKIHNLVNQKKWNNVHFRITGIALTELDITVKVVLK